MKRNILCGLLFLIGFSPFPGALEALLSPEQAAALFAEKRLLASQSRNPSPRLAPRNDFLRRRIEELRQDLNPNVMVETLYLYIKPPGAEKTAWSAGEKTALFNSVLALSSLAGLEYYSASRGGMRTFYELSTVIDGPVTKNAVPDPSFSQPQAELTIFARQKDLTFGDNVYQYDFYSTEGAIIFIQQNLTPLNAGIIPAIGRNRLRSIVAVLDAGDYLLVYAASMARAVSLPGMNERVGASFANRAEAVLNWFSSQADEAFDRAFSF